MPRVATISLASCARDESMDQLWIQRQIDLEPRPRGFHLVTSEIVGAVPELALDGGGRAARFHPAHVRLADAQRERQPGRPARLRGLVRPRRPRRRPLLPAHPRGPRRHARAHQVRAHRQLADRARDATAGSRSGPGRASTCASTATAAAHARCRGHGVRGAGPERCSDHVRPRMRTCVRALERADSRGRGGPPPPGLPRAGHGPDLRRARGARHPLLRGRRPARS